jgi:hypothetical protein
MQTTMENKSRSMPGTSYLAAFLLGFIMFISFVKNWLGLDSLLAIQAGAIGVALSILMLRAWDR